jgi:prepilin-type N-terminal cleavage/methylation domain-containing protein
MKRMLNRGMTLVEILLVVTLIGLLAAFLIPAAITAIRHKENAQCASLLRRGVAAFELYRSEMGGYPPDQSVPSQTTVSAMADYFDGLNIDWWGAATPLGGRWDWDIGYHGFAASLSIWNPTKSAAQLTDFDRLIDDGNLATGKFRQVGTQYHYILQE